MLAETWHVFRKTVRSDPLKHRKPPIIPSDDSTLSELLISADNAQGNSIASDG